MVNLFLEELNLILTWFNLLPDLPGPIGEYVLLLDQVGYPFLVLADPLLLVLQQFLLGDQFLLAVERGSAQRGQFLLQFLLFLGHYLILRHVSDDLFGEDAALALQGFYVGDVLNRTLVLLCLQGDYGLAHLTQLAFVLFLNLRHLFAELLLTVRDGLLLRVVDALGLAVALHELVFEEGEGFVHAFDELGLFCLLCLLLLLKGVLELEVLPVFYG